MSQGPLTEVNRNTFGRPSKINPVRSSMPQNPSLNPDCGTTAISIQVTHRSAKPGRASSTATVGYKPQRFNRSSIPTHGQGKICGENGPYRMPLLFPLQIRTGDESTLLSLLDKPENKDDQGETTSADEGLGTSNTLGNLGSRTNSKSATDDDSNSNLRAPPFDCIENYWAHLAVAEHKEILQLQMKAMYEEARKELKDIHPNRGMALSKAAVGTLFHLCVRLKTSDDVKYLACEIYDTFMIKFSESIMNDIRGCTDKNQLNEIDERLRQQVLLRMGSCIQLASKVSAPGGFGKFITSSQLKALLMQFQQNYSLKAINRSEARTAKYMDWKMFHLTSLNIVEILLIQLDLDKNLYRKMYHLSTHILDYVYMYRETIYTRLFELISIKYNVTKEKFREMVQFSKIIEGASIVGAALLSYFPQGDPVFQTLETVSTVEFGDCKHLSTVMISLLLEDPEKPYEGKTFTPIVKMSCSTSIIT